MAILEVKDLTLRFGGLEVIDQLISRSRRAASSA